MSDCQSSLCRLNGCMFPQACPNDRAPMPDDSTGDYDVRECRGHWHVTVGDQDVSGQFTESEAREIAARRNAGETWESIESESCRIADDAPATDAKTIDLTQTLLYRCEHGTAPFPCTCGRSAPAPDAPAERELNPTRIADAPIVDYVEGIYIAKAPNGNLLLATIRTMQNSGEHIVVSANALAALLRALSVPVEP